MKKLPVAVCFSIAIFSAIFSYGQSGVWTWISGTNTTNATAIRGTQGVPSVNNHPPGAYEYAQWKDQQGNLWIYGGTYPATFDLWKYNPATNEWTWVNGVGSGFAYAGPLGVFDPSYTPGSRIYGAGTWVDTTGNLWLFGGYSGGFPVGELNDLWEYDISLNQWAWMGGNSVAAGGYHGTKGVRAANVNPGCREECTATWTDSLNNLWLFGGYGYDDAGSYGSLNDLMKYNIATGEWTWVSGSSLVGASSSYGTQGVPDSSNMPGARFTCSNWKDEQGNFWFMGGAVNYWGGALSDVWKYDVITNTWTWMDGPSGFSSAGTYTSICVYDSSESPRARFEHHSSTTDYCGKFYLFGGAEGSGPGQYSFNDLWVYDPVQEKWNWLSGTGVPNQAGSYGTLGVSSASNIPPSRNGANAWWGNDNRFYLFGGMLANTMVYAFNDLWVFTPDSSCISLCIPYPVASFSAPAHFCPGVCNDFLNLSLYATGCQWIFAGAIPDTSTAMNPVNICYSSPGTYDVTLIVNNQSGSDTLVLVNYITVYPDPPPQSITQSGDSLLAISGASMYQWYFNGTIISGATDFFYLATANGDYNVVATDSNGCEVEAAIFNVLASAPSAIGSWQLAIFPNPVLEKITIRNSLPIAIGIRTVDISVYNMLGESVWTAQLPIANCKLQTELDVSQVPPGIYYLEMVSPAEKFRTKFVKQ